MHDWCAKCGVSPWKHGTLRHAFVSALTPVFKPSLESYTPKADTYTEGKTNA